MRPPAVGPSERRLQRGAGGGGLPPGQRGGAAWVSAVERRRDAPDQRR
ncbi:MAG: hypothetical protein U5N55_08615 [Cypionkella sp.]|nr:hypothetical protein [Cypionkella sp.]